MGCGNKPCGCEDEGLTTPNPCPGNENCPDPNPCAETFSDCCIIHTNDTIVDIGLSKGMSLCQALQLITLQLTNPDCIAPDAACKSVIGLQSTTVTPTTIKVVWTALVSSGYQVEYKPASSGTWLVNPSVPSTQYYDTIGLLTPNTLYHIRVGSICRNQNPCYSVTIAVKTKP